MIVICFLHYYLRTFHSKLQIVRLIFEGGVWSRVASIHNVMRRGEGGHITSQWEKIVCRCPHRRTLCQLSLCFFCILLSLALTTFKVTYVMWWGHTWAQRHTQSSSIGAMKCSLFSGHTHNLPGGLESRQKWPDVVLKKSNFWNKSLSPS